MYITSKDNHQTTNGQPTNQQRSNTNTKGHQTAKAVIMSMKWNQQQQTEIFWLLIQKYEFEIFKIRAKNRKIPSAACDLKTQRFHRNKFAFALVGLDVNAEPTSCGRCDWCD